MCLKHDDCSEASLSYFNLYSAIILHNKWLYKLHRWGIFREKKKV